MPPARSRANAVHDDSRSEASAGGGGSREKVSTTADKRRQTGGATLIAQDKASAAIATTNTNGTHAHEGIEGVSLEPSVLPSFRPPISIHTPPNDLHNRWAGEASILTHCTDTGTRTSSRCLPHLAGSTTQFCLPASGGRRPVAREQGVAGMHWRRLSGRISTLSQYRRTMSLSISYIQSRTRVIPPYPSIPSPRFRAPTVWAMVNSRFLQISTSD